MNPWLKFLKTLDTLFDDKTINEWIKPIKLVNFDARNVYLKAENPFQIAWFNEHISQLCREKLLGSSGKPLKVHLICDKKEPKKETEKPSPFATDFCDPLFNFDTFVASGKTLLSYKLLSEITAGKASSFGEGTNPVFIYGPASCGKTHLLTAAALALKAQKKKVLIVHAQTFSSHVVHAFRGSLLQEFRQVYRDVDVLIIDDVHLLKRKTSSQEELFHTFNWLHTRKKQIILSSRSIAGHLEDIEDRLVSRFEWGISLAVEPPGIQEMEQILEIKAGQLQLHLETKLKSWLLTTFNNAAAVAKALSLLSLYHHSQELLDQDRAEFYLKDMIALEQSKSLTLDTIINKVCSYYGIKNDDVKGRSQNKEASLPRQISMYLCREKMKTPYLKLGEFFGRDHSTVITSVKTIKGRLKKKEPEILAAIDKISKALA